MKILMKENYGNLKTLEKMGINKKNDFTTEQLLDENLKNNGGESRKEVSTRVNSSFNNIISKNLGKKIAIVSHGATLKFLLMNWCKLNVKNELEYNKNIIRLNSPGVIKLIFSDDKIKEIEQIV